MEITPPVGVPTGGGGPDGYVKTEYVLDPLYARALALNSPDGDLMLLQADLLGLSQAKAEAIAARIAERTGIPAGHVLIVCPQTHNAGCTFNRDFPDAVMSDIVSAAHRAWYEALEERLAGVAAQAAGRRRPALAGLARGCCRGVSGNRRALMKAGGIRMAWSDPPPEEVLAWGPEDEDLIVIRLRDAETGKALAALWHFTGHPNSLWMLPCFSRDYPGVVEDLLMRRDPDCVVLFCNGFCGDMDTYRCMGVSKEIYTYPFYKEPGRDLTPNIQAMRRLGGMLGAAVQKLSDEATPPKEPWHAVGIGRTWLTCRVRDDAAHYAGHFLPEVELAAFRIGPVGFACAPFEPVAALALAVKRQSPAPVTVTVGHTPAYRGYLPDQRTLDEGGFEAGTSWRGYAPGAGEQVAQTLVQCLAHLFG